jgi:monofunctional glycosyltransferase
MMKPLQRFGAITAIVIGILLLSTGRYFCVPDLKPLRNENPASTSFIKYRERQWVKKGQGHSVSLRWVPYDRISPNLIRAVVVSEDAKFWRHHGFDLAEMKNAARTNIEKKHFKFGASTISQQLVKNLYLRPSKNVFRKTAEAILTWRLERTLSKKRILEIYLNVIEWGDGVFGIGQAARHYFGKTADALTPDEASRLAVVLPSPRRYNPLRNGGYVEQRASVIMERAFPEWRVNPEGRVQGETLPPDTLAGIRSDSSGAAIAEEVREPVVEAVKNLSTDTSGNRSSVKTPSAAGSFPGRQE